jgi:hypothetical protein
MWSQLSDNGLVHRDGWTFTKIPLLHPEALAFASSCGRFAIVEADAFTSLTRPCDVIRAMNLYQTHAFDRAKIRQGLAAALDSLVEGGIFIAGKTIESEGSRNDVSIYRKVEDRFELLKTLGRGFEQEALALSLIASHMWTSASLRATTIHSSEMRAFT